MKFTAKNDFIVKNKDEKFFDQDLKLFKEHCPNSRLNSDIKRVNSFNKRILDGHMLFELLDKVTPEEILKNREVKPEEHVIETLDTIEAVSEFLKKESPDVEYPASILETLTGKTAGDIQNFIEFGKLFITQSENHGNESPNNEQSVGETNGNADGRDVSGNDKPEDDATNDGKISAELSEVSGELAGSGATVVNADDRVPDVNNSKVNELSEKASDLESKEQKLDEKESELDEKEEELAEKEAELDDKEAELEEKEEELKVKEKEVEQKAAAKTAAKAISSSKKKASTKNSKK